VEGEKEDAARALEEEFDEMEGLEERVRRLRGMREALRAKKAAEGEGGETETDAGVKEGLGIMGGEDEESEDDEDADGWGPWGR